MFKICISGNTNKRHRHRKVKNIGGGARFRILPGGQGGGGKGGQGGPISQQAHDVVLTSYAH